MRNFVATSCVGLWALALFSGCGSSGSHATKPDSGSDSGGGAGGGGADGGGADRGGTGGLDGGKDAQPDAGACPAAGTCGGNIVGSWMIASSCLDVDVSGAVPDYCPTATAQPKGFALAGTLSFKANLTYSTQTTITGAIVLTFPASCLTGGDGGALTCDQLVTQLMLDVTYDTVTCAAAGTGCACTGTLAAQSQTKTGMYTTTSSTGLLVESPTGGAAPVASDYCIKTDTLTTSPHAMGMSSASGTIAATRVPMPDAGADSSDAASEARAEAGSDAASEAGAEAGSDATVGN